MNKALFLMLAASVGLNVYLVNVEVVVKDDLDQEYIEQPSHDKITIAQAGLEKDAQKEESLSEEKCAAKIVEKIVYKEREEEKPVEEEAPASALKTITENDLDSMSKDQMQELAQTYRDEWRKKSQNFFEYKLGLTPSQQSEYEKFKVQMEDEISEMLRKSSPEAAEGQARMVTSEEMMEMGRIHKKYAEKLKNSFGPNAYEEYLSFREDYNRSLSQKNRGVFGINF